MSKNWQSRYAELTDFIAKNPQVRLEKERLDIPQNYREEFYKLFNTVRSSFVEDEGSRLLEGAAPLAESYLHAEAELLKNTKLSAISIPPKLKWFVDDPLDGLRRSIYDLLFDLLREKVSMEQFEALGRRSIHMLDSALKAQCYQYWVILSLANLLKPEKYYTVDLNVGTSSVSAVQAAQSDEKPVKEPEETDSITLAHTPFNIFIIPDILMRSARLDRFVAIRGEPNTISWAATNPSENREWMSLDQDTMLIPGLVVINTSDSVEDLPLVRDTKSIARPELALVCREAEKWHEQGWFDDMEEMKFNMDILKPKLGMHIVSRPDVPEDISKRLDFQEVLSKLSEQDAETGGEEGAEGANDISIINAGLDSSNLEQIIDMLA